MPTGDGLLVRLVPLDSVALADLRAICAAARRHGNGTIEITARGSLQVRGLSACSAPAFARAVTQLDIVASDGLSVVASPIPDDPESIIDPRPIAAMVRRAVADASLALSAKVSVIIDGGGRLHLDALPADIKLLAIKARENPLLQVSMGGDAASATSLGAIALPAATDAVLALLGAIAAQGPQARAADIVRAAGIEHLRSLIADHLQSAPVPPRRAPAEPIGSHRLRDESMALGMALPFGHAHADTLAALAAVAGRYGVHAVRLASPRALLLLGLAPENAAALRDEAARLGFIVDADDPRRRIVACPGKPSCASGLIAARALATELAQHLQSLDGHTPLHAGHPVTPARPIEARTRQLLNPAVTGSSAYADDDSRASVHISGCAKGCAHPGAAALTVVGTQRGCGIVHHGSARTMPNYHVDPDGLLAEIEHILSQSKEAVDA